MRIVVLVLLSALLSALSATGQVQPSALPPACGLEKVSYNVKLDESQHALVQPEPGKALVYFIQEKGSDAFGVTTRIGMDGKWVGANKNSSSFALSVEPGDHHVCADVHSFRGNPLGLLHFTAEAGKSYYFDARIVYGEEAKANLFFGAVDSDQGEYLIGSLPLSVSNPKQ